MHFYLLGWRGAGTDESPFTPDIPPAVIGTVQWGALDLRADQTAPAGWCIVGSPSFFPTLPTGTYYLGDLTPGSLPRNIRNGIGNRLGVTLQATDLGDLIGELLTVHAREDGTRWRPVRARRIRSALGVTKDRREVWINGVLVWEHEQDVT